MRGERTASVRWSLCCQLAPGSERRSANFQWVRRTASGLHPRRGMEPDVRSLAAVVNLLSVARRRTRAQAGSVYRRAPDGLRFVVAQNDQLARTIGHAAAADLLTRSPLRWTERSVATYVALTRAPLNIPDAYNIPADKPYAFNARIDGTTGFHTMSMLVVPLRAPIDGVLQLLNATNEHDDVIPFSNDGERLVQDLIADLVAV